MSITFSNALILFAIGFTMIYLFLSIYSRDVRESPMIKNLKALKILKVTIISLGLSVSALTLCTNWFKDSLWYITAIIILTILIFLIIINGDKVSALISLLSLQITLHFVPIPKLDMIILEEGSEMTACLARSGFWDPICAHNPSYNPFPVVASIITILSQVVGVEWYRWTTVHILFYIPFYIAYDLLLINFSRALIDNWRVSYISVYLITITPETFLHGHSYQWLANLLNLTCLYIFIKILRGSLHRSTSIVSIIIAYLTAILTHATAMNYLLVLLSIIVTYHITTRKYNFVILIKDVIKNKGFRLISNIALAILIVATSITFIRAIYTYNYEKYIVGSLIDFIRTFISPEIFGEKAYRPLYERTNVNPIQAYVWSLAIAIATADILYAILKKDLETLDLALFIGSTLILALGYIYVLITPGTPTTALYRGMYTAIPYIIPIASRGLYRTLENSRITLIISLIILALATPIASQDPGINFKIYEQIKGSQTIEYTISDYIEALILYNTISRTYSGSSTMVEDRCLFISERLYKASLLTAARGYLGVEYRSPTIDVLNMLRLINGDSLLTRIKILERSSTDIPFIPLVYHSSTNMIFCEW